MTSVLSEPRRTSKWASLQTRHQKFVLVAPTSFWLKHISGFCDFSHRTPVVPKVGSFTQCAVRQYTHRAEVLSLLHICADMGARW